MNVITFFTTIMMISKIYVFNFNYIFLSNILKNIFDGQFLLQIDSLELPHLNQNFLGIIYLLLGFLVGFILIRYTKRAFLHSVYYVLITSSILINMYFSQSEDLIFFLILCLVGFLTGWIFTLITDNKQHSKHKHERN